MSQELTPIGKSIEELWKLDGLTDYQKTLVEKILESNKPKEQICTSELEVQTL
jgi:hypothetical protein